MISDSLRWRGYMLGDEWWNQMKKTVMLCILYLLDINLEVSACEVRVIYAEVESSSYPC